jgi:hypothetical protein
MSDIVRLQEFEEASSGRISFQDKEWHVKREHAQAVASREECSPLGRTEAVQQAVEVLGYRADVAQILDYVREHFGIDATTPVPTFEAVESLAQEPRATEPVHRPASQPRPRSRNRSTSSE